MHGTKRMSLKEVYEKHYADLVKKLPMRDARFMGSLTSAGFLVGDLRDQINAERTPADKATTFLETAITPYMQEDDEDIEELQKLLKEMDKFGGIVKRLADKIKADLPAVDRVVDPVPPDASGNLILH